MKKEFWHYIEMAQENNSGFLEKLIEKYKLNDIVADYTEDSLEGKFKEIFNKWYIQNPSLAESLGNTAESAWGKILRTKGALGIWKIKVTQAKNTKTLGNQSSLKNSKIIENDAKKLKTEYDFKEM